MLSYSCNCDICNWTAEPPDPDEYLDYKYDEYCKEKKKKGEEPLEIDEWLESISNRP
jgi:hypothetical protein